RTRSIDRSERPTGVGGRSGGFESPVSRGSRCGRRASRGRCARRARATPARNRSRAGKANCGGDRGSPRPPRWSRTAVQSTRAGGGTWRARDCEPSITEGNLTVTRKTSIAVAICAACLLLRCAGTAVAGQMRRPPVMPSPPQPTLPQLAPLPPLPPAPPLSVHILAPFYVDPPYLALES